MSPPVRTCLSSSRLPAMLVNMTLQVKANGCLSKAPVCGRSALRPSSQPSAAAPCSAGTRVAFLGRIEHRRRAASSCSRGSSIACSRNQRSTRPALDAVAAASLGACMVRTVRWSAGGRDVLSGGNVLCFPHSGKANTYRLGHIHGSRPRATAEISIDDMHARAEASTAICP